MYLSMHFCLCIHPLVDLYHVYVCACVSVREIECAFVSEGVAQVLFTVCANVYLLAQQVSCCTHESMCVCMRSCLPGGENP